MPTGMAFIVLLERRWQDWQRWLWSAPLLIGLLAALLAAAPAQAQPVSADTRHKVARDFEPEIGAARAPQARWARDVRGVRHVQAIVVGDGSDPDMSELRAQVLRLGGSVHASHPALHALTVQMPARQLQTLAQRSDVLSISPNRSVRGSASTLEAISGVLTSRVRSYPSATSYSGLDGSGVGIAVLDSGIMKAHRSFQGGNGASRVKRSVNLLNGSLAAWSVGVDSSTGPAPGSSALASYESAIANDSARTPDAYGHGTHVASVAAGRGFGFSAAPDSTGIAPGADLYDVKVLDGSGNGTLSDTLKASSGSSSTPANTTSA